MAAAKEILEQIMSKLEFNVRVEVAAGETNRLNVVGEGDEKEALGALIGRKGSVSPPSSTSSICCCPSGSASGLGSWWMSKTTAAAENASCGTSPIGPPSESSRPGKCFNWSPCQPWSGRWIHLALRDHERVATQSIGEEPNRRVVVLPREV